MDFKQIAHDLAIAKLNGSNLSAKELIAEYNQLYEDILSELYAQAPPSKQAKVFESPF